MNPNDPSDAMNPMNPSSPFYPHGAAGDRPARPLPRGQLLLVVGTALLVPLLLLLAVWLGDG